MTGSPAALGLLALMQLLPILLFSLGGGALSDVVDRRRLLLVAQLGMAGASILLLVGALTGGMPLWAVLGLAFLIAGFFSVEHPARVSSVPRVVPPERLSSAIALTSLNFQAASVVGPAISGVLIALAGLPAAFALQSLAYIWAAILTLRIRPLPPMRSGARPSLSAIADGLRFVRKRRLILSAFVIDFNAMVFGLPIALFPVLAIDVFGIGPAGVGLLAGARGAGALVAAIFSGWIPSLKRMGQAVIGAVLVWGLVTVLVGLSGFSLALAVVLVAIAGAADVSSAVLRTTIVQMATPDELRGRVSSIYVFAASSGPRVGDLRAALMAQALGAEASIALGGLAAIVGATVIARLFPELRHYRPEPGSKYDGSATAGAVDAAVTEGIEIDLDAEAAPVGGFAGKRPPLEPAAGGADAPTS